MTTECNSKQKRRFRTVAIMLLTLLVLVSTWFVFAHASKSAQTTSGFTFTALGDYAQTSDTAANLNYILIGMYILMQPLQAM